VTGILLTLPVWERRRLSMKPGITCYWQIQLNRNDISFKEWMRLDLKYIDNWSLWVDTKIVFRTVWVMLTGSGR
jgi:lipopolysaccharide/colanic/teichoic acid biosynthesis glycosyltransferase